jgi:chemosensory pili system protein ChpE
MRLEVILIGMMMGLAFAAPPGIVTTETLRRGLRGGFAHALSVQVGSLVGDASYAFLALAGLASVLQTPLVQMVVGGVGALFLLYLAVQSLGAGSLGPTVREAPVITFRASFLSGMVLSLTNPWAIAFWISLGGSFFALGLRPATDVPLVLASFMAGALVWSFVLSALIERGRCLLSPRLFRGISVVCGLLLAAFAISVGARLISTLLIQ